MRSRILGLLLVLALPRAVGAEPPWDFYNQCCFFMFEHAAPVGNPPANSLYVYAKDVAGVTTFMIKRSDGVEIALVAGGGAGAPATATYITQTADAGLSNEQALGALGTGILKSTTVTGVLSIAVAGDFPTLNQNTTGTAAALTANGGNCAGNNFALGVDAAGVGECAQPAFSNLSGAATDAQVPDSITVTLAGTASALAANGGNCSGNNFALGVDAAGVGECAQPAFSNLSGAATDAQVPDTVTIDLATLASTATALAADPTDCATSTHFAVGVNASGTAVCEAIADADVPNTITVDLATLATTATTATTANAGDSATAFFPAGTIEVARGGTGSAPASDDQVLVSDSTSAATWRSVPDCGEAGTLNYTASTNTFSCLTDGGGGGGANTVETTVTTTDTGIFTVTVTGQTWVAAGSEIVCSIFAVANGGTTPEMAMIAGQEVMATNRVAGTGFDVVLSNPNGAVGTFTVHCTGA